MSERQQATQDARPSGPSIRQLVFGAPTGKPTVFIELVPGGELTPQLHELRSGNEILMRKVPWTRFVRSMALRR